MAGILSGLPLRQYVRVSNQGNRSIPFPTLNPRKDSTNHPDSDSRFPCIQKNICVSGFLYSLSIFRASNVLGFLIRLPKG
jgi:hypothetical protein